MRPRSPRSIRSRRTRPSSSRPRANPRRSSRSSSSPTAAGQDRAMDEARSVREFWFGRLPLSAEDLDERMAFWFGEDNLGLTAERDEEIRARFGELFERAAAGELESWADGPRRRPATPFYVRARRTLSAPQPPSRARQHAGRGGVALRGRAVDHPSRSARGSKLSLRRISSYSAFASGEVPGGSTSFNCANWSPAGLPGRPRPRRRSF